MESWTKDARKAEKDDQQARAWDLWLECLNQEQVASESGISQAEVSRLIQERKSALLNEPPASRQHFDIWTFQNAAGESSYFGKMPPQVVENLLWLSFRLTG